MGAEPDAESLELLWTVAAARLVLGPNANVQVPPNLSASDYDLYLDAGINDWGGVSPLTIDYVNPEAPWPLLAELRRRTLSRGFELRPRLPVYPEYFLGTGEYLPAVPALPGAGSDRTNRATLKGELNAMPDQTDGTPDIRSLESLIGTLQPAVAGVLDRALAGEDITVDEAVVLFDATGPEFNALGMVADELRRRTVGDIVTYVVNRNINFTNVCIKRCGFCAFSRDYREEEGYFLPVSEIIRRAGEARDYGATEVCIQAGLPPQMEGDLYIQLCRAIKEDLPDMHIHGFSPEEVLYGSIRSQGTIREYLEGLEGRWRRQPPRDVCRSAGSGTA